LDKLFKRSSVFFSILNFIYNYNEELTENSFTEVRYFKSKPEYISIPKLNNIVFFDTQYNLYKDFRECLFSCIDSIFQNPNSIYLKHEISKLLIEIKSCDLLEYPENKNKYKEGQRLNFQIKTLFKTLKKLELETEYRIGKIEKLEKYNKEEIINTWKDAISKKTFFHLQDVPLFGNINEKELSLISESKESKCYKIWELLISKKNYTIEETGLGDEKTLYLIITPSDDFPFSKKEADVLIIVYDGKKNWYITEENREEIIAKWNKDKDPDLGDIINSIPLQP